MKYAPLEVFAITFTVKYLDMKHLTKSSIQSLLKLQLYIKFSQPRKEKCVKKPVATMDFY